MASTSIGIIYPTTPTVDVMVIDEGESMGRKFMAMRLGEDVSVIPPGYGAELATYARALAAALSAAAEQVEAVDAPVAEPVPA
jgi:hypothetical protein